MSIDNRELIKKIDTFVADLDGGALQPEQARQFIQMAVAASTLQQVCRTMTIPDGVKVVPRLGFGTRILNKASEGQALPESKRAKPSIDSMRLETFAYTAEVRLSYDVLMKNVEKMGIEASIKNAMAARIGLDVDDLVMNGNVASADPFYTNFNGMRALAGHNTDVGGTTFGKDVMRDMMGMLPVAFKSDKKLLGFFASPKSSENYGDELASRATALGDKYIEGQAPMFYNGARVLETSVMPEDLGTIPNLNTEALLFNPQNAVIGYTENVTFELDKDISARMLIIVATIWVGFGYEQPDGVVLATTVGL
jgi:hypothetical protein